MQMLKLASLASFERVINELLAYDPYTQNQVEAIQDVVIKIEVTNPGFICWVHFNQQQIRLISEWQDQVDASIKGSLSSFIALMKEEDKTQALMKTRMEVSGNTQLLTQIQNIAAQLNIDWEAAISDVVGDVPGHLLANMVTQGKGFFNEIKRSLDHSWSNYWQHESDSLIASEQYKDTASAISQIRFETDRLDARINRILNSRGKQS